MKKISITGALISGAMLGVLGSAMAADMPAKAPLLMKAPPPAYSWTGCWVSGGIGYGLWNQDHSVTNLTIVPPVTATVTTTDGGRGWLGRVGVGCDYQASSSFVLGLFGDYDFMSLKGSNAPSEVIGLGGTTFPVSGNMTETGAWAFGGRIGYLVTPNLMSYVDGGYTRTRFTQSSEFANSGAPIAFAYPNYSVSGWFLGGGTEYQVPWSGFNGLFWRSEYRFASYN
jgi:outer membrane immunogenic protein